MASAFFLLLFVLQVLSYLSQTSADQTENIGYFSRGLTEFLFHIFETLIQILKLNVVRVAIFLSSARTHVDIVVLEGHVLFDDSLYFHFAVWSSFDAEGHVDGLAVLLFHNFSMVLKYGIEIRKSQVPVELFYLRVQLSMWVALVSHRIIILRWVLKRIEIVVLNISST